MALVDKVWSGSTGLVTYGSTLLFVDSWNVQVSMDTIDITNISIYTVPNVLRPVDADNNLAPFPNLPFPQNQPDGNLPYYKKNPDLRRKQTQYGGGRINLDGGLRVAAIQCTGLCASYDPDTNDVYLPRIGNYVYMQFSNSIDVTKTLFNFPICIVKEVTFDFNVKNYSRWTMNAITTGEFDIFPGTT